MLHRRREKKGGSPAQQEGVLRLQESCEREGRFQCQPFLIPFSEQGIRSKIQGTEAEEEEILLQSEEGAKSVVQDAPGSACLDEG